MRQRVLCFWIDARGTLLVTDWLFLATILIIGVIPCAFGTRTRLSESMERRSEIATYGMKNPAHKQAARFSHSERCENGRP